MGTLTYDSKLVATIDDRALAHLQLVIVAKLRRGESFAFTYTDPTGNGLGRATEWMHPAISLTFQYFGSRMPAINPAWVQALSESANSNAGLQVIPESDAPPRT